MSTFTYEAALDFLNHLPKFSPTHSLIPIIETLAQLGNPQDHIKTIHVAGTNGKGSTCTFIQEVLLTAGYKVGFYFSPFILEEREAILIQNTRIPELLFAQYVHRFHILHLERIAKNLPVMTHFETLTAIAYLYFFEQQVDFAVIEVGLGGLNDATNVLDHPTLSVITSIALDHTDFLGNSLEAIATAKSGIIKKNCPVVVGKNPSSVTSLISELASSLQALVTFSHTDERQLHLSHMTLQSMSFTDCSKQWGELHLETSLIGVHQMDNIACALTALWVLHQSGHVQLSTTILQKGIANATWPCRTEFLATSERRFFLDGAHNPHGVDALCQVFNQIHQSSPVVPRMSNPSPPQKGDGSVLIFGVFKDKDYPRMLAALSVYFDTVVVVEPPNPRGLPVEQLVAYASDYFPHIIPANSPTNAIKLSKEATFYQGMIFVAGSLNLVGVIRDEIVKSIAN